MTDPDRAAVVPSSETTTIGPGWQLLAWLAAIVLSWWGFQGTFAEWPTDLALFTLAWLLLGPFAWFLVRRRRRAFVSATIIHPLNVTAQDIAASLVIGGLSLGLSITTALPMWNLPPAYHDEYSYVFQAETLLAGRFSWPSAASHPELFDQMHVLNEGRMASRYYPGTGLWIAPWLAFGMPYLGHWVAGALSAILVYWIGRELSDRRVGWLAGIVFAAAPGPALFSNLLLAHHPTMLALLVFTLWFFRGMQQGGPGNWLLAGGGLSAAMLCRPMTAAGYALPFGVWALVRSGWAWRSGRTAEGRRIILGLGVPLVIGWGVMLVYNHDVTGNWFASPYQIYTDLYTPRHVFGLNNVVRGEQHLGPKVLESYDTWAENLTPSKAWENVLNRLISTAMFTVELPLLLVTLMLSVILWPWMPTGWKLIAASIITLQAVHWPFWYVGIFGWHYVFESAPVWCLVLAYFGCRLQETWKAQGRALMPIWAAGFFVLAWLGMYVDAGEAWTSRWKKSVGVIVHPRQQYALFRDVLRRDVTELPALVLVDGPHDGQQLDFVTNSAGLAAPILLGRLRNDQTDLRALAEAYPQRHLYRYHMKDQHVERIESPLSSGLR